MNFKAYTEARLTKIELISSKFWQIDTPKLMALLRSQVYSGNAKGAMRVIEDNIPERRLKVLPAIALGIILFPFRLLGRIIGLGLRR